MTKVIGVRFRQAGKIYFFAPGKYHIEEGEHVIVETARGVEYGHVVLSEREVEDDKTLIVIKLEKIREFKKENQVNNLQRST